MCSESNSHSYAIESSSSPPFRTAPTPGSPESGKSAAPPTSVSGDSTASMSATSSKPKRKRSMIACKNCNERRIRCDGSTIGLPCSNCQHGGRSDCAFIESKRVRGARGRFESKEGKAANDTTTDNSPARSAAPASLPNPVRRNRRHSVTGADNEEWRRLLQQNTGATRGVTYLGESWHLSWVVHNSSKDRNTLHLPSLMLEDEKDVHNRLNRDLWDKGAYILPRPEIRDLLVADYFRMYHYSYPILNRAKFLHSLRTNTFSHLLTQAVLVVASIHCDMALLESAGYTSRQEAVESFYKRARSLYDGDVEPDKLTNIQSMFLMQFWWRSPTDHKDTIWWQSGAIRLAHSMGLHRSARGGHMKPDDQRMWRRIWWMLYLRDRQACPALGKPMLIHDEDCDVEDLSMSDFDDDDPRDLVLYVLEQIKLSKILGTIATLEFSPGSARMSPEVKEQHRSDIYRRLQEWQNNIPPEMVYIPDSKNLSALSLQVSYETQIILLNRPGVHFNLKGSAHSAAEKAAREQAAADSADNITQLSAEIINTWGARYMNQHAMAGLFSAMTVQVINKRSPDPTKAKNADQKLMFNMNFMCDLEKILPVAGWVRKRFLRILSSINADDTIIGRKPTSTAPPLRAHQNQPLENKPPTTKDNTGSSNSNNNHPQQPPLTTTSYPDNTPLTTTVIRSPPTLTMATIPEEPTLPPALTDWMFNNRAAFSGLDHALSSSLLGLNNQDYHHDNQSYYHQQNQQHTHQQQHHVDQLQPQNAYLMDNSVMGGGVADLDYQWFFENIGDYCNPILMQGFSGH